MPLRKFFGERRLRPEPGTSRAMSQTKGRRRVVAGFVPEMRLAGALAGTRLKVFLQGWLSAAAKCLRPYRAKPMRAPQRCNVRSPRLYCLGAGEPSRERCRALEGAQHDPEPIAP